MYLTNRRRLAGRIVAIIAAVSLIAACGNDSDDNAQETTTTTAAGGDDSTTTTEAEDDLEITYGGTLTVGLEAETNSWLPSVASVANAGPLIAFAVYDPIAARGADGEIHPYLAESIEHNDDLTEWTITLREGIKFHDGTDLTSEVIKKNFDNYLNAEGARSAADAALIEEIRIDDPLTYTYVLKQGNAAFIDLLTARMGWPFSNEACEEWGDACGDHPVGTGPFVFESWNRDAELKVVRNENYWRKDEAGNQLPYLDAIVFRPIPDEDTRFQAVRAGDNMVGQTLRQTIVRQAILAADSGEINNLVNIGNNGTNAIFNTLVPPMDDTRVRLGLAHAVEQSSLIAVLGGEGITPDQTQFFSPDSPWYSSEVADAYPKYDPEKARELLDEYVNDPSRSDGKAPGSPISLEFQCPPDPTLSALTQGYQQFWSEVGVETHLNQVDQAQLITNVVGSADQNPPYLGNYMISCYRLGSQDDPYTAFRGQFGDVSTQLANSTNYTSDNIDAQIEVLRTSTDFSERYAAVESMMMEFTEQMPLVWTGGTATALFSNLKVHGLDGWYTPEGVAGIGMTQGYTNLVQTWIEK
ncbi:MAG: ABC transporter substrate-binding protein [Acidimicrobiia bacterium]